MKRVYIPLLFMLLIGSVETSAQDSDLARIEYTYIPQTDSENSISRFRGLINFPIRLNWDGSYLVAGFEYRNLDLDFEDPVPFSVDELGKFQLFRTTLAYTFKLKNDWRFAAKVGAEANSNFETGKITNDDTNFTGALFLIKSRSGDTVAKPSRLILGLNYTTNAGRPFPIPIVNYYKKFHPNWSYSVGTPKTNLKHFWKKKHSVQAYVTVDGFFSNIQNNLEVPLQNGSATAENISMTMIFGGLGYEYFFSEHLLFYAYGGYSFYNEIRLRDEKRNSLFKINERNTYYLRTGIKFKI